MMNGERLPASYANFYIANGVVLVPTFNDPNDRVALNTLAELMPPHQIVGIHAVDLVWGLGTLHCLTQQEPLGTDRRERRREPPSSIRTLLQRFELAFRASPVNGESGYSSTSRLNVCCASARLPASR